MKKTLSLAYGAAFPEKKGAVAFTDLASLAPRFQAGDAWLRENATAGKEGFGWMNLARRNVDDDARRWRAGSPPASPSSRWGSLAPPWAIRCC